MLALLFALVVFPHGDLSIRIAKKTAEIELDPTNLLLYMQRGELHAQHEQPDSALIDYEFAIEHGFDSSAVYVLKAEALLALGNTENGLSAVTNFLKREPDNLKGIHVRAQLYEAMNELDKAVKDYTYVLAHSQSARPQDFVHLSNLYLQNDSSDFKNAIDVLNRGRSRLGNIISLELKLYDIQKLRKNYAEAHQILDRMMKPLNRKERLLVEKAELYLLQEKPIEAAQTLIDAENAIATLPLRFQNIGATKKLIEKIEKLKQSL